MEVLCRVWVFTQRQCQGLWRLSTSLGSDPFLIQCGPVFKVSLLEKGGRPAKTLVHVGHLGRQDDVILFERENKGPGSHVWGRAIILKHVKSGEQDEEQACCPRCYGYPNADAPVLQPPFLCNDALVWGWESMGKSSTTCLSPLMIMNTYTHLLKSETDPIIVAEMHVRFF